MQRMLEKINLQRIPIDRRRKCLYYTVIGLFNWFSDSRRGETSLEESLAPDTLYVPHEDECMGFQRILGRFHAHRHKSPPFVPL